MHRFKHLCVVTVAMGLLTINCSPPSPAGSPRSGEGRFLDHATSSVKRITMGLAYEPNIRPGQADTNRPVALLLHTGLSVPDGQRARQPRLAESVPSLENGLWKLLPEGRMETTWRLRDDALWHDGAQLTTADLLFSLQVGRDREMSTFNAQGYPSIEDARASDDRTLTIFWKEPFIDADAVFDARAGTLLPRHLLEEAYRNDKATFLDLPYWTSEFVGAGPYRLREWAPGGAILLDANDGYVLGRPGIDRIEVQYIPDASALSASLLAGAVDLAPTTGSVDAALDLRDKWRGGTVSFNLASDTLIALFPQLLDPHPAIVTDLQFRRALTHAIDRQTIVDTLVGGLAPVAHTFLSPNQAMYRDIEATVPRYEYDPRLATEMLNALGYRKGADGIYLDETSQPLELNVRSGPTDTAFKPAAVIADSWHQLGVGTKLERATQQQFQDGEYLGTFPAFFVVGMGNNVQGLRSLHSSQARLPSNNFRASGPGNRSRYMNPEFDALLETYFRTVPAQERIEALGEIIRYIADQDTLIGLFVTPISAASSDRILNVSQQWPGQYITWNAHEWDVRS